MQLKPVYCASLFSLLFSFAAAATVLSPAVAARLASLVNEGEDTPVTEALLKKGDHPGTDLEKALQAAVLVLAPFVDESVKSAGWNDAHMGIDGPVCFDGAPKTGLIFRAMGWPGYVVANGHHVFMIAETSQVTLLIDPTIHQYFGQDGAPDWVPQIFVGTLSELKALYEKDPGLPVLPYQAVYFDPDWTATRRDSKMLSQRDALLASPDSAEYAPLAEYLNENFAK